MGHGEIKGRVVGKKHLKMKPCLVHDIRGDMMTLLIGIIVESQKLTKNCYKKSLTENCY
jgi:hypothetical protein